MSSEIVQAGVMAAVLAALCWSGPAAGQATPEDSTLQPFVLRWDDTEPAVLDLSFLSPGEAGADGPVRIGEDGHLYSGPQRLRLFGNNVSGGTVFATITDDQRNAFAGRMRKFGYNAVRYHHLGANWFERNVFGIVENGRNASTRQIDPESLDRLQRWFAALKRHGIYSNMNLLVSRRFVEADGVAGIDAVDWKLQGTIAMWHPRLIELQKDYARQLLAADNPHTGVPIAHDPSLATVEINNENGILHAWFGGQLDRVPPALAEPLRIAWNQWLKARYADEAALIAAWGAQRVPLGNPMVDGLDRFFLERHGGAVATIEIDDGEARIGVERPGGASWHVQWGRSGLTFAADRPYTLRFEARADDRRAISVNIGQAHEPWEGLGFSQTLRLTPEWRAFEFTIVPSRGDDNGRVIFSNLAQQGAAFAFRNISLRPGGTTGGVTTPGAVPLPLARTGASPTRAQRRDFIAFCMDAERAYFGEMRRFLRDELGVTAPVVGTIIGCSPMGVQKEMDAIDTHAYWRHPEFPGRPWDPNNWSVGPESMVDYPHRNAMLGTMLKQVRIGGRRLPHMLTEYDHPAPNPHAGEGPLFLATLAAVQDYDAVYLFCYDRYFVDAGGRIEGFFDTLNHPTVAANALAAALIFRRGDIAPAAAEATIAITDQRELDALAERGQAWSMVDYGDFAAKPADAYNQRVAVDFADGARPQANGPAGTPDSALRWTRPTDDAPGLYRFMSPQALGMIGAGPVGRADGPRITIADGRWATAVLCRLEGVSLEGAGRKRALLVATRGYANTGWAWKDDRRRMLRDWGRAPSLVETVPLTLTLPSRSIARAWALGPAGERVEAVAAEPANGAATLRLGPGHTRTATLWYEIEWE